MTTITPLGTSGAIPAYGRHFSATTLAHDRSGDLLLFDCGEGTQFRLAALGAKPGRLRAIFVTHLHGDHCYGLHGLIGTLALVGGERESLLVVGPTGIEAYLRHRPGASHNLPFRLDVAELDPAALTGGSVYEGDGYCVEARALEHGVPCVGYRFQESDRPGALDVERARSLGVTHPPDFGRLKRGEAVVLPGGRRVESGDVLGPTQRGQAFAYVTDTRPCDGGRELARGADLVYHEATFGDEHVDLARRRNHSTARQAAEVARDAGAQRLLIGHFSARYRDEDLSALREEARAVFPSTELAVELEGVVL